MFTGLVASIDVPCTSGLTCDVEQERPQRCRGSVCNKALQVPPSCGDGARGPEGYSSRVGARRAIPRLQEGIGSLTPQPVYQIVACREPYVIYDQSEQ
jgi:hypothetical protein